MTQIDDVINLGFTPERYPRGTHACYIFSDEIERRSVVYPFVRAGLQEGDDVHYFADALVNELLERAIDERSTASLSRDDLKRLHIASVDDTYFPTGEFVPDAMIDRLQQLYEDSRALGSAGCRVAGEMTWAVRSIPGSDHLVEYEESINSLVETNPLAVLCQYDTEQFDGATLYDVLSVHPLMVVRGQIMRNSAYVASEKQKTSHDARRGSEKFQESVLARLYLVQLIITGLPDELRIAEFTREALAAILGVDDVHLCLTTGTIPPDERWEPIRQRCERAASNPNSFDVSAVEAETGCSVFLLRTTSRLFGLILIDVADAESFSPYEAVLANIANAVAMALEVKRDNAELRTWPERVANLERRLWRIGREFEGAEVIPGVTGVADPYALPEVAQLSPRQWEVLTRLLQGDRVPRIAEELLVSQSTVRNHLGDMFKKLGVHSQEELLDLFRFAKTE